MVLTSEWIYRHLGFPLAEHAVKYVSLGSGGQRGPEGSGVGVAGFRGPITPQKVANGPKTHRISSRHFEEMDPSFCQLSSVLIYVWDRL